MAVMERVVQQCEHNGVMIAQNNALLRKAVRKEVAGPASLPEGVVLPITSLAQLHAVEAIIQEPQAIKQMVRYESHHTNF